eukprot:1158515-Pelagomonas_calceolata.AAC.10
MASLDTSNPASNHRQLVSKQRSFAIYNFLCKTKETCCPSTPAILQAITCNTASQPASDALTDKTIAQGLRMSSNFALRIWRDILVAYTCQACS